ncbi:flagellar hook capping FlgD N-terminal domain-containing protein [Caulobacter sp. NIBR1757]|uniref:flagellar hook assembly protein FlgD n=1 Tax=Caulobacter sp. NIBR1757 TaxID=3016000 RepID=UPI0022EFF885|nr:flagellar hook capping FlgD N-terminal domain-containing protein [Caulobacter sp. NIBR1757]
MTTAAAASLAASTSTTSTTSSSSTTAAAASQQMDDFLQILMTQLQTQNPLDPMDTAEFTSQLVSYSQLEQQLNTNTTLENLAAKLGQLTSMSSLSYLGATTEIDSATAPVQDGEVSWSYSLDGAAASTTLTVTDADGEVVWSGTGDTASGSHSLDLSLDDLSGVSEGEALTLTVTAVDASGTSVASTITAFATPTSVSSSSDGSTYTAGDLTWADADILKIHDSAKS